MGATTDTCADMSWVLWDECGTVVRGLCQRPVFGYGLRVSVQATISFWLCFWFLFWFLFRFQFRLLLCCLSLAFVHGLLYFSFGYVFCPRYAGIMLLEGGLTGNTYGLQRMSHL